MITGYKRKTLGNPSEKLSGDTFRATWGAVLFSEIIFPIFMAVLFLIAYLFVKSFPVDGKFPPSPLIRIGVIALGPIAWNAAILIVQFFVSLYIAVDFPNAFPNGSRFGSVMAAIAHVLAVLGLVGAFEFLVRWVLSSFSRHIYSVLYFAVVPGTMGCIPCGYWYYRGGCDSTSHPQNLNLRLPFP
jgi:1,3-beta-glucan synthase